MSILELSTVYCLPSSSMDERHSKFCIDFIYLPFLQNLYLLHNIRLFYANLGIFQFRNNLTDQKSTVYISLFFYFERSNNEKKNRWNNIIFSASYFSRV